MSTEALMETLSIRKEKMVDMSLLQQTVYSKHPQYNCGTVMTSLNAHLHSKIMHNQYSSIHIY